MKKEDGAFAVQRSEYSVEEGLTKYEYMCIEFMKALIIQDKNGNIPYTDLARRAKKAANELCYVMDME